MQPIGDYYDSLAGDYDEVRFGNSYGRYVDHQEREISKDWLTGIKPADVTRAFQRIARIPPRAYFRERIDAQHVRVNSTVNRLKHTRTLYRQKQGMGLSGPGSFHP